MKSKAPLVMMEQIVMVLIFALAAALCLQTVALSGKLSKRTEARNRAVVEAQNAAETMKNEGIAEFIDRYDAVQQESVWVIWFDEAWNIVTEKNRAEYCLQVLPEESENIYLWRAVITVTATENEELIRITAAGQTEVTQDE